MKVAVIPARGGSKRLPGKNIVEFHGKPMIAWTIHAAVESKLFDKVIVSTDSEEIADISRRYGAHVPFLRQRFYDDNSAISDVVVHVLEEMKNRLNEQFDVVCQLMANCPLRHAAHIVDSYNNFEANKLTFQLSCCRYGWLNPWWAFQMNEGCDPVPLFPDALESRSQDLAPLYCPSGAIWIADARALLRERSFYAPGYKLYPIEWRAAVDIDDLDDLDFAKAVYLSGSTRFKAGCAT